MFNPIFKGRSANGPYKLRKTAISKLPPPPQWRDFRRADEAKLEQRLTKKQRRGETFYPSQEEVEMVNAALYLRRPLLVTGKPGTGKTSLAYAIAYELDLGEVLYWPITTRTTLKDGLYSYDAIARLQDFQLSKAEDRKPDEILSKIGSYIRLGALGTAFLPSKRPLVLLIDEIDKSDIDLPNDLLHIFEEGEFIIPELERIAESYQQPVMVRTAFRDEAESSYLAKAEIPVGGRIRCEEFPLVILTSNAEREFPPAFLRRCLRLDIELPTEERLKQIITSQLNIDPTTEEVAKLIKKFLDAQKSGDLATDQLLNAVFLVLKEKLSPDLEKQILRPLGE